MRSSSLTIWELLYLRRSTTSSSWLMKSLRELLAQTSQTTSMEETNLENVFTTSETKELVDHAGLMELLRLSLIDGASTTRTTFSPLSISFLATMTLESMDAEEPVLEMPTSSSREQESLKIDATHTLLATLVKTELATTNAPPLVVRETS